MKELELYINANGQHRVLTVPKKFGIANLAKKIKNVFQIVNKEVLIYKIEPLTRKVYILTEFSDLQHEDELIVENIDRSNINEEEKGLLPPEESKNLLNHQTKNFTDQAGSASKGSLNNHLETSQQKLVNTDLTPYIKILSEEKIIDQKQLVSSFKLWSATNAFSVKPSGGVYQKKDGAICSNFICRMHLCPFKACFVKFDDMFVLDLKNCILSHIHDL